MFSVEQLIGKDTSALRVLDDTLVTKDDQLAQPEANHGLLELQQLAKKQGQPFLIVSSYRSFEQQQSIWNRKFNGELPVLDLEEQAVSIDKLSELEKIQAIMLFSALPGASRHHWGTDFDIFPAAALAQGYQPQLLASEFSTTGIAAEFNHWLTETLPLSDFFRPYDSYQQGVACEPWHISYYPIADIALNELNEDILVQAFNDETAISAQTTAGRDVICKNIGTLYQQFISNISDRGILS